MIDAQRLTPEQFKALARYKGWKFKLLAERWGVTPEWISMVSRDPQRDLRYDDALHGLPNLKRLARDLKARQRSVAAALGQQPVKVQKFVPLAPGYRYRGYLHLGAIVTAAAEVGSIAEEGMRGVIFEVRDGGDREEYGVIFETGLWDWFAPDHVDRYLAGTGLTAPAADSYRYADEERLQVDFEGGQFDFWPAQ